MDEIRVSYLNMNAHPSGVVLRIQIFSSHLFQNPTYTSSDVRDDERDPFDITRDDLRRTTKTTTTKCQYEEDIALNALTEAVSVNERTSINEMISVKKWSSRKGSI